MDRSVAAAKPEGWSLKSQPVYGCLTDVCMALCVSRTAFTLPAPRTSTLAWRSDLRWTGAQTSKESPRLCGQVATKN